MSTPLTSFLAKAERRELLVGIIGLGYVGLPLARAFTAKGFRVIGFDIDSNKVAHLQRGNSYIAHISADMIQEMQKNGFEATDKFERLSEPDAILICVPTPLTDTREPDLTFVASSAQSLAATLRAGQLIVLESTTYPGTTRQIICPTLEREGLRCGHEFFLAFSPEREDPGNPTHATPNIPKVIGGIEPLSLHVAATLYSQVFEQVVPVSSCEVAEACKILENTYRCVNIALVNELKVLYSRMGIDIWEVIDAAKTKPFGFQAFYPGPGLGGHCIPIDPFYLAWLARKYGSTTRFIELAGEVNTAMPEFVVGKISSALNDHRKAVRGSNIALLGIAYKKDVDDVRESPGLELMELLSNRGALVEYNDPHIPELPTTRRYGRLGKKSHPLTAEFLKEQDCVVVVTDHSSYDWSWIVENCQLIVDTRNATRCVHAHRQRIVMA
jgi:UDP-N-acetyl-D-glucosamine dehydrogenase